MKTKEINVLMVKPYERPVMTTIKNDLDGLQEAVGGLIEIVDLSETACVLCNEEGKLIGLAGNRTFYNDILVGTFYVCGMDHCGNLISLSDEDIKKYTKQFWEPEYFTQEEIDDSIVFEFIDPETMSK